LATTSSLKAENRLTQKSSFIILKILSFVNYFFAVFRKKLKIFPDIFFAPLIGDESLFKRHIS
jgi:hypothetical protein